MKKNRGRVLVTGGAGFIGSHLCEELVRRGYRVTAVDDCSTGNSRNLLPLKNTAAFRFIRASILDRKLMSKLVQSHDMLFHLAAAVGVKFILNDPIHSLIVNTQGTEIVFELAAKFRKKVLLASTSEIYGKHSAQKIKEEDGSIFGSSSVLRWNYAVSKVLDEFLAHAYRKKKHLKVIVVRFFNIVGPRQSSHYGMVLPRLVQEAVTGKPLTVFGDGKQIRTFLHVGDAVRAVSDLSQKPAAYGRVFNIGGDQPVSINQLAKKIKRFSASRSPLRHFGYKKFYGSHFEDIRCRIPDITRLKKAIGFKPHFTLDQILSDIIASVRISRRTQNR